MNRDPRSYLEDIVGASRAILSFVETVDENRYAQDDMLHSAVERKFEIIGEALSQPMKSLAIRALNAKLSKAMNHPIRIKRTTHNGQNRRWL